MGYQWRACKYCDYKGYFMNVSLLYIRLCFALTLIECAKQLYSAGSMLLGGYHMLWSIVYIALYGLLAISAVRMIRHHHVHSAQALITLRIGIIIAIGTYLLLLKPTPPITVIAMRLSFHFFQLFVAYKAKQGLIKESAA